MQPEPDHRDRERAVCQEALARDLLRMAYVAKDGTPRNVPIALDQSVGHGSS